MVLGRALRRRLGPGARASVVRALWLAARIGRVRGGGPRGWSGARASGLRCWPPLRPAAAPWRRRAVSWHRRVLRPASARAGQGRAALAAFQPVDGAGRYQDGCLGSPRRQEQVQNGSRSASYRARCPINLRRRRGIVTGAPGRFGVAVTRLGRPRVRRRSGPIDRLSPESPCRGTSDLLIYM